MQKILHTLLVFFISIYANLFTSSIQAQELEKTTSLEALGLTINKDEADKLICKEEGFAQIANETRSWYTLCENLSAKDFYSGITWKRSNFQKKDFQKGFGDAILFNRIKKSPSQNSGQINCEEDKSYVDTEGLNAVKVTCIFNIVNAKPLHINMLYVYPKKAAKLKINAVVVVSSEDSQVSQTQFSAIAAAISK